MSDPVADAYVAALDARCDAAEAAEAAGAQRGDGPGIRGLLSIDGTSPSQLLVVDDRAVDRLADVLPLASTGTVRVYEAARRYAVPLEDPPGGVSLTDAVTAAGPAEAAV